MVILLAKGIKMTGPVFRVDLTVLFFFNFSSSSFFIVLVCHRYRPIFALFDIMRPSIWACGTYCRCIHLFFFPHVCCAHLPPIVNIHIFTKGLTYQDMT